MTPSEETRTARRITALAGRSAATVSVAVISAAAITFGVGTLNDRAAAVPDPEAAPSVPVEVATVTFSESYDIPRRFIGQTEARASLALSFELGGRIEALLVDEGEPVTAGQELARLDTDLLQAEAARLAASRAATASQLTYAEARLSRALTLQKEGFTSQETLDRALADRDELRNRIAEIEAAQMSVSINLQKSVIYAPLSGQVGERAVDGSETVQAGRNILTVIDRARPEFRVGLPLDVAADPLRDVRIDLGGHTFPATFKRFRPDIDPVTRTRTALFDLEMDTTGTEVLVGQTAVLELTSTVAADGSWVPLDALQSGTGSVWTVMVVTEGKLKPAAVEVLHSDGARAFVRGSLEQGDEIVVSGAHRVVAGQNVRVQRPEG